METILTAKGIDKSFFGQKVVDNFCFTLKKGSIHALLGHNGAGKSTFLKILSGVHRRDRGTVIFNGKEVNFENPREAMDAGIQMVYQELDLIPYLSGAENIYLGQGRFHNRLGLIRMKDKLAAAEELVKSFDIEIDLLQPVCRLNISKQQIVALAKAISTEAKILILDEPTATLNESEANKLFSILRVIAQRGTAIILITHRLEEVYRIADEITVMRDGKHIFTKQVSEVTTDEIIKQLTNTDRSTAASPLKESSKLDKKLGAQVLECEGLTLPGVFQDVDLSICEGEVLGITGLIGCGSNEVAGMVFGERNGKFTKLTVAGIPVKKVSPQAMRKLGVAYVPDDRKVKGLNTIGSVVANNSLTFYDKLSRMGWVRSSNEIRQCRRMIDKFGIQLKNIHQTARSLSGGNQQKLVLAKWLQRDLRLLILSEPTRGIDAVAKSEIHETIKALACDGLAILVVSSEIEEIVDLCDDVLVLFEGKTMGRFQLRTTSKDEIVNAMYGESKKNEKLY